MENTAPNPVEPDTDDLPPRVVTMTQVIAYNVTHWRRLRGITQEKLGELLETCTGKVWSKASVSALERSWDGKRIRKIDGDDILALARVLDVPIPGLFLPPDDDFTSVQYYVCTDEDTETPLEQRDRRRYVPGAELLSTIYPEDEDDAEDYLVRVNTAVEVYRGSGHPVGLTRWPSNDPEAFYQQRFRLRQQRDALRGVLADMDREIERYDDLMATKEKRDRQSEARSWKSWRRLMSDHPNYDEFMAWLQSIGAHGCQECEPGEGACPTCRAKMGLLGLRLRDYNGECWACRMAAAHATTPQDWR